MNIYKKYLIISFLTSAHLNKDSSIRGANNKAERSPIGEILEIDFMPPDKLKCNETLSTIMKL